MSKLIRKIPWWQDLQIIGWSVGGFAALGTAIVVIAKYIELPTKVEAAQQKNVEQDKAIDKLSAIEETWQKVYQQQQQAPNMPARPIEEYDDQTKTLWCCDEWSADKCWNHKSWYVCPSHHSVEELGRSQ